MRQASLGGVGSLPDVPVCRRRLTVQLSRWGLDEASDDAALVLNELVTNALLHGVAPVGVTVRQLESTVRLEVSDRAEYPPEQLPSGPGDTTGRGLHMIEALSAAWGWHPTDDGKLVWCDVPIGAGPTAGGPPAAAPDPDQVWRVCLPDVPVRLLIAQDLYLDGLLRELTVAGDTVDPDLVRLRRLLQKVVTRRAGFPAFGDARAAHAAGRTTMDFVLDLPLSEQNLFLECLAAVEELDVACRDGRLLTLEATGELKTFRRWFVGEVRDAVRRAAGLPAPPPRRYAGSAPEDGGSLPPRRVSLALTTATTASDVVDVIFRHLPPLVDALRAAVFLVSPDGGSLLSVRMTARQPGTLAELHRMELDADYPVAVAARGKVPMEIVGVPAMKEEFPHVVDGGFLLDGERAWRFLPLVADDALLGVVALTDADERHLTGPQWHLLQRIGEQAAHALRRAERSDRDQQVTRALQRTLLDDAPPVVAGLEVATRYRPAQASAVTGGDWYDVFEVAPDLVAVTVGDVCGHGVEAAVLMGRLRSALAALGQDDPRPGRVLDAVNRLLCRLGQGDRSAPWQHASERFATALFGVLDRRRRRFVYAVAGHPGPVVADLADGTATPDEPAANLPLGIDPAARFRVRELRLPEHGALLAYTDGLLGRRGQAPDVPPETLLARAAAASGGTARELADILLAAARPGANWSDDVALAVLRW